MRLRTVLGTALLLAPLALLPGCARDTARLSPEQRQRFETEGIVRRGDNLWFRYTHGVGTYQGGWEEHVASIVVTRQTLFLHQNERVLLEVTPRSTGEYVVRRDHDRVSLRAGSGRSARSWAFHPPEDPDGWAIDLRAVIKGTAGAKRRGG